jgi:uncharacterized protein YjiS (DUF1127 family)
MSRSIAHSLSFKDIAPSPLFRSKARRSRLIAGTRRALREIAERNDLHLLKDIGVSQEEALREADKAFWRL